MSEFLIQSFLVTLINVIVFTIALAVAIRRRLLPVQPEIEQTVDKYFHALLGGGPEKKSIHAIIIETAGGLLFRQPYHSNIKFVALSTAMIVVTTVTVIIPLETTTTRATVRTQTREEKPNEEDKFGKIILPTVVTPLQDRVVA